MLAHIHWHAHIRMWSRTQTCTCIQAITNTSSKLRTHTNNGNTHAHTSKKKNIHKNALPQSFTHLLFHTNIHMHTQRHAHMAACSVLGRCMAACSILGRCFRHLSWWISNQYLFFKSACFRKIRPKVELQNCVLCAACSFQFPISRRGTRSYFRGGLCDGAAAAFAADVVGVCHQCRGWVSILEPSEFSIILWKSAKCEGAGSSTAQHWLSVHERVMPWSRMHCYMERWHEGDNVVPRNCRSPYTLDSEKSDCA